MQCGVSFGDLEGLLEMPEDDGAEERVQRRQRHQPHVRQRDPQVLENTKAIIPRFRQLDKFCQKLQKDAQDETLSGMSVWMSR